MKPLSLLLLLFLFLSYCKKNNAILPTPIIGTWNWFATYADYPLGPNNPMTPQNTGNQEILIFNSDKSWKKFLNNISTDSGIYTTGHGAYTPYVGATTFVYDSIVYYKNGVSIGSDPYIVSHDTLIFSPGSAGEFSSYSLPNNGSKWLVKQ
jgi:hypothetical protein